MREQADLLRDAARRLAVAGVPEAMRDARKLIAHVAPGATTHGTLSQAERDAFERLVARRCAREPVSHLLGRRAFWRHDFLVTPDVLDPRPETERLVEVALARPFDRVLDLGTGSGAILLSLLADRPSATGLGTDLSDTALAVARRNADSLGVKDRASFALSDWWDGVSGAFDLIVSNPPYIALAEMAILAPELAYEPRAALTDEADGLTAYRRIVARARDHLVPGGRLCVEIGPSQAACVAGLFEGVGLMDIATAQDLDGRDRVVFGTAR